MNRSHLIIKWINRIIVSIFLLLIALGFSFDKEIFIYAILFTVAIGISQFLSALVLSFQNYKKPVKQRIRVYIFSVILYFILIFFYSNSFNDLVFTHKTPLVYISIILPSLLLIYFTFLSEIITNDSLKK